MMESRTPDTQGAAASVTHKAATQGTCAGVAFGSVTEIRRRYASGDRR
ncbi:hypothetical protein LMG31841_00249 [Paraburkholderia saeva]|uniref:Uncharacterized protein n=1 Tax=Paraburkholderia saeva TaxID=2777537 RepID=A0A9N8X0Q6_9BURK|nr:hypothetical protein LMG31841_00249 [Paraburkholderia saeva]